MTWHHFIAHQWISKVAICTQVAASPSIAGPTLVARVVTITVQNASWAEIFVQEGALAWLTRDAAGDVSKEAR